MNTATALQVAESAGKVSAEVHSVAGKLDGREETRRLKRLAEQQRREFAWKPWKPGVPTVDALGYSICFQDEGTGTDSRYWVSNVRESGAHIRNTHPIRCLFTSRFYAYAKTEAEAVEVGEAYAEEAALYLPRIEGKQIEGGQVVITFNSSSRD